MFAFAFIASIVTLLFVLLPLLLAKDGRLASASSLNSPERLEAVKQAIIRRYVEDEKAFEAKAIPEIVWKQRKSFLTNRYIDAARRLDFIRDLLAQQNAAGEGQDSKAKGV